MGASPASTSTARSRSGTPASPEILERRRRAEAFVELATEPPGVRWTKADAGGVPGLWAEPVDASSDRVVQYLPGGGYLSGSSASHRRLGGHLARAIGCRVLLVDYGRAPENPHPGPVSDSIAAYRSLLAAGIDPSRIALAGDSSGGGLALATMLKLRDDGIALPAAGVALSPWVDLEVTGDSATANAGADTFVTAAGLHALAANFLAGADIRDPLAAPIHGNYRGLSPLYLQVGGVEVLLDDTRRVAEIAADAGVEVSVDVFPGMHHVFQMRAGNLAEADDAIARIAAWLRPRLGLA